MSRERQERDDEDLIRLYLGDIGTHSLLSKDDESRLGREMEDANEARLELSHQNLTAERRLELLIIV